MIFDTYQIMRARVEKVDVLGWNKSSTTFTCGYTNTINYITNIHVYNKTVIPYSKPKDGFVAFINYMTL